MQTLFKAIVGSKSYGTAIETSDTDTKFVFQESLEHILGFGGRDQYDVTKDNVGYEIRRFLSLLQSGNPTVLELLFTPDDCVIEKHPAFDIVLANRNIFLTKKCKMAFGGYAIDQIRKSRGLSKKVNWEANKVAKKTSIDFCYIIVGGKTYPFNEWMEHNSLNESQIALVNLDHAPKCYAVYVNFKGGLGKLTNPCGVIRVNSVPKEEKEHGILVYNKDSYQIYQKEYESYQIWLKERNEARYVDTVAHGQKIDGKNLLHCRRLLNMALEIPQGIFQVRRPEREELLKIRRGEVNLNEIIDKAEEDIKSLDELYKNSNLPDEVDRDKVNQILLEIRKSAK